MSIDDVLRTKQALEILGMPTRISSLEGKKWGTGTVNSVNGMLPDGRGDVILLIPSGTIPGGTNGQIQYNNNGSFGGFSGTSGSVLFIGSGGVLAQDNGNFYWDYTNAAGTQLLIRPAATTQIGFIIQGQSSQTADLQEWKSSSALLTSVQKDGTLFNQTTGVTNTMMKLNDTGLVFSRSTDGGYTTGITTSQGSTPDLTIKASGSVFIMPGSSTTYTFSNTGVITAPSGFVATNGSYSTGANNPGLLFSDPANGTDQGWKVVNNGRSAQSLNTAIMTWVYSSTELARIDTSGRLYLAVGKSTAFAKGGGTIFNHFADVSNTNTTETDLYSDTLPANTLATNGDKLVMQYGGSFTGAVSATQELRAYFGGTLIFDSGALSIGAATDSWNLDIVLICESSTVIRATISLTTNFATLSSYATYTRVTGLTLTGSNIMKITGQAGGISGASNQITASMGYINWLSA